MALIFLAIRSESCIRVLIGSPIRQDPTILQEFLDSLLSLEKDGLKVDYCFVNDNIRAESTTVLESFCALPQVKCTLLPPVSEILHDKYTTTDGHKWGLQTMFKVGGFRNAIIEKAACEQYDYLFLVDSDMVLHPRTLLQLIGADKPIISEIWWTSWNGVTRAEANVWLYDCYGQDPVKYLGEEVGNEEKIRRYWEWQAMLEEPGVYPVGGLCGCTLINKEAIAKGVNFKRIDNLTFWGEDRHFCVRARALDVGLFVDTHYPAYHIYRPQYLEKLNDYKQACKEYPDALPKHYSLP